MAFINSTSILGIVMVGGTSNITGSVVLTLLIVLALLLALAFMFQIPLEFTAILMLPFIIAYMSYYTNFIIIGFVIFIYLTILITSKFILK